MRHEYFYPNPMQKASFIILGKVKKSRKLTWFTLFMGYYVGIIETLMMHTLLKHTMGTLG